MSFLNGCRWINGIFTGVLNWIPTGSRIINLPDASGTVILDSTIGGFIPVSRVLVHARQDASVPITTSVDTLIPFATEVIDSQNLFLNGFFTPTSNGLYRCSCSLFIGVPTGFLSLYAVSLFQGTTKTAMIFLGREMSGGYVADSGAADIQLAAGVAYHLRAYCDGTNPQIYTAADIKNFLTIERLT